VGDPGVAWRNRITGSGEEAPDQLVANPQNWRVHPGNQRDALRGSLATVGWVQQVLVNQRTGHVVDGHARVEEALSRGEATVPVLYVDLDPEEEALVLATLDPISAMANTDDAKLRELLADDAGLAAMLGAMTPVEPKVTDPPWNVDYQGGTKKRDALENDHIEAGWDAWLTSALKGVPTDENAPAYLFFGLMRAGDTQAGVEAAGWRIVQTLVWVKQHAQFGNFRAHYKYQHEPMYYCSTGSKLPEWRGPNNAVSVWSADRSSRNDFHPTQKPVELAERAMENSSRRGALVGEPFSGSGSTIIAAEQLGRRCYAMEIDPRYVAVAIKRWEDFTGQKSERIDG
jgi:DNA modification methylase